MDWSVVERGTVVGDCGGFPMIAATHSIEAKRAVCTVFESSVTSRSLSPHEGLAFLTKLFEPAAK